MRLPHLTLATFVAVSILACSITLLVAICSQTAPYKDYELWGYDFLINHDIGDKFYSDVVIVDFDEETFDRIKQYPISRQLVAQVISNVAANSPRVVGLDMFLSEPRSRADDESMSKALADAGNVVLASQTGAGGVPPLRPLRRFCEPEIPEQDGGDCKEAPKGAAGYAAVNIPIDSDGFVRSFFLFAGTPRNGVSFPVMIAQLARQEPLISVNGTAVKFLNRRLFTFSEPARRVLIGAWCATCVRHISATSLLDHHDLEDSGLKDKIVLIGQTYDAARDSMLTPLFRPEPKQGSRIRLAGVEVHAAAINTLLSDRAIEVVPSLVMWLAVLVVCGISVWLQFSYSLRTAMTTVVAAIVVLYAAAQGIFTWGHMWFPYTSAALGVALSVPATVTYRFLKERLLRTTATHEREQIMGLFSRYVSPEVAYQIWERRSELVLAGEEKTATVLFSDIRSFTALTAGKDSQRVLQWLNEYLCAMDEVITANNGFLNKFIGDGLMVLFGVPLSSGVQADACRALRCAAQMLERVEQLNVSHREHVDYPTIKIGIGMHTGKLTCGNIGSRNRIEYSVIGETVNLSSRLEGLTKDFHTDIVLSADTYAAVREMFPLVDDLGEVPVRGFAAPIKLYGLSSKNAPSQFAKLSLEV